MTQAQSYFFYNFPGASDLLNIDSLFFMRKLGVCRPSVSFNSIYIRRVRWHYLYHIVLVVARACTLTFHLVDVFFFVAFNVLSS